MDNNKKKKEDKKLSEPIENKDPTKDLKIDEDDIDEESSEKQSLGDWAKNNKLKFGGIVVGFLILIVILMSILFGGNKSNDESSTPKLDNVKIQSHENFLDDLETSKDSMIDTLNDKLAGLENSQSSSNKFNYLDFYTKDTEDDGVKTEDKKAIELVNNYEIAKSSFLAKQAEVMQAIISDITGISNDYDDKDLEIIRKRVSRYFKDDLSKSTYKLVEASTPTKVLEIETKLVGVPIVTEISRKNEKSESLVYCCIAGANNKQYTAIYHVDWDNDKIVDMEFYGVMEGFKL